MPPKDNKEEPPHPGPRVDKIPVSGAAGLLFVAGAMLIVLMGLPASRWFILGAAVLGLGIAVVLRATDHAA